MKFFSLLGVALAKECFEAVLPTGVRVERGEVSVGELNVAIEEFAACAERDANVDVTPFYEAQTKGTDKTNGDCFKYFVNAMYECTKIQAEHPFCVEDSGAYDPLMCTLKINQCCVEELAGINDCL